MVTDTVKSSSGGTRNGVASSLLLMPSRSGSAVSAASPEFADEPNLSNRHASPGESTVTLNVSVAVSKPSLTVRVIVATPLWFGAGVTRTVRSASRPPNRIFVLGTSAGREDEALSSKFEATVSASPMVTGSVSVAWF